MGQVQNSCFVIPKESRIRKWGRVKWSDFPEGSFTGVPQRIRHIKDYYPLTQTNNPANRPCSRTAFCGGRFLICRTYDGCFYFEADEMAWQSICRPKSFDATCFTIEKMCAAFIKKHPIRRWGAGQRTTRRPNPVMKTTGLQLRLQPG